MTVRYFRILELEDGSWACRRGRTVIDEHASYNDALDHICDLASADPSSQVFVHPQGAAPPTMVAEFGDTH